MDSSSYFEWLKLRLLLAGVVMFVVSGFFSCSELNYLARGKTIAATKASSHTVQQRGRYGTTQELYVSYEFNDGGKVRKESDEVALDFNLPSSGPIMIEYIPDSADYSRLEGHHHWWAITIFTCSFIPIGLAGWKFWKFYKS
jgi:hypothetical protein